MNKPSKYVVLLRGVNAGGKRRVPKAEFQKILEDLGFREVCIYINSGNAVFSYDKQPVVREIQAALEAHFQLPIPTLLLSAAQVRAIADAIPIDWTNDPMTPQKTGNKSDVVYLLDNVNEPEIIHKIGYKPAIESMKYVNGAVITTVSRKNQAKGSLQKLVSNKAVYHNVTIRNVNTARKLAELAND